MRLLRWARHELARWRLVDDELDGPGPAGPAVLELEERDRPGASAQDRS